MQALHTGLHTAWLHGNRVHIHIFQPAVADWHAGTCIYADYARTGIVAKGSIHAVFRESILHLPSDLRCQQVDVSACVNHVSRRCGDRGLAREPVQRDMLGPFRISRPHEVDLVDIKAQAVTIEEVCT